MPKQSENVCVKATKSPSIAGLLISAIVTTGKMDGKVMLKRLLIGACVLAALAAAASAHEPVNRHWFAVGKSPVGGSFGGHGISVKTSCAVKFDETNGMYAYTIALNYESDTARLLSWNALDWVLSQYPNAMELRQPHVHLFPLKVGKGDYTFRFQARDLPVWIEETVIQLFAYDLPDAKKQATNQERAEEYSGVTVSSYEYLGVERVVGMSICIPSTLLVFPNNVRSGF